MIKQIFYIVAVVILMIIVFRLMKKVDSNHTDDPYQFPERSIDEFSDEVEDEPEAEK
jgi:hypothetical protein